MRVHVCVALAHAHWWENYVALCLYHGFPRLIWAWSWASQPPPPTLASVFSLLFAPPLAFSNFPQT